SGQWPASNMFYGLEPSESPATSVAIAGTPGAGAKPNILYGYEETNGAAIPVLNNLSVYASNAIVVNPGGNNASTNILGAWSTYTPSPACGTATIATVSARRLTMGKTTHIQPDFTITALWTCTLTLSFTAPVNSQAAATFVGQEVVNTGKGVTCFLPSASSAVSPCRKADQTNFAVNDRLVITGIYENP